MCLLPFPMFYINGIQLEHPTACCRCNIFAAPRQILKSFLNIVSKGRLLKVNDIAFKMNFCNHISKITLCKVSWWLEGSHRHKPQTLYWKQFSVYCKQFSVYSKQFSAYCKQELGTLFAIHTNLFSSTPNPTPFRLSRNGRWTFRGS